MKVRILHILLIPTLLMWAISSCSKLEDEETDQPSTEQPDGPHGDYDDEELGDTLTVVQTLQHSPGEFVIAKGYIVGYIDGPTMGKAKFEAPSQKANTNIIIADSPTENDYKRCLPIQLKTGTNEAIEFNLLYFPDQLGKAIAVEGELTTYFKVNGFKHPNFWITELTEDETISPPEEEPTPDPEPIPDPAPVSDTPTLDHTPQTNIYGR